MFNSYVNYQRVYDGGVAPATWLGHWDRCSSGIDGSRERLHQADLSFSRAVIKSAKLETLEDMMSAWKTDPICTTIGIGSGGAKPGAHNVSPSIHSYRLCG